MIRLSTMNGKHTIQLKAPRFCPRPDEIRWQAKAVRRGWSDRECCLRVDLARELQRQMCSSAPAVSSRQAPGPLDAAVRAVTTARNKRMRRTMPALRPDEERVLGPQVLIVDDDHSVCDVVARMLAEHGYAVDAAFDGHAALTMLAQRHYALAILDYQMPDLDGVEVFRRAKQQRQGLLGVLLTAHATVDTVFPAMAAGFTRVLAKPVDASVLIPLLQQLIARPRRTGPVVF
jgi:CheY-like chemotaxis protein